MFFNDIFSFDCVVLMLWICNGVICDVEVFGFEVIDVCLKCIDLLCENFDVIFVWMWVECEWEVIDEWVCG